MGAHLREGPCVTGRRPRVYRRPWRSEPSCRRCTACMGDSVEFSPRPRKGALIGHPPREATGLALRQNTTAHPLLACGFAAGGARRAFDLHLLWAALRPTFPTNV